MDEEEIKNIVIQGYRNILKREPDPGGLENYVNEIKNGLDIKRFYEILSTSNEYKEKFNIQPLQNDKNLYNTSKNIHNTITYCMIGFNKIHEIKPYIETILPYVDRFIYIDGNYDNGSTDGTIEYLQSLNLDSNNKVEIYIHKWQDNFSNQRNFYLKHFTEKQDQGWILVSDTDEHFPVETLSKLNDIICNAEYEGYNGIKIRAYDIIVDDNDPNKIISETISNFWKPLLFKYHPSIYYQGNVHESVKGPIVWKQTNLIYHHIRSQKKIYERAVENFWIYSDSSQYLKEFRYLCKKNNILNFGDFFTIYKEGLLPKEIENWMYEYRNYKENSKELEVLEIRDMTKLYFEILHKNKYEIRR